METVTKLCSLALCVALNVAAVVWPLPAEAESRVTIDAGPPSMTQEMQTLALEDAELARLGEFHAATGNIAEASALQFQRLELRRAYQVLLREQAVALMEMGDFSMAASAVSNATGASVQI